jgi:hypothetical protein
MVAEIVSPNSLMSVSKMSNKGVLDMLRFHELWLNAKGKPSIVKIIITNPDALDLVNLNVSSNTDTGICNIPIDDVIPASIKRKKNDAPIIIPNVILEKTVGSTLNTRDTPSDGSILIEKTKAKIIMPAIKAIIKSAAMMIIDDLRIECLSLM